MRKSTFRISQTQYLVRDNTPGQHHPIVAILPDKQGARAFVVGKPGHTITKHLEYNKTKWLQYTHREWAKLQPTTATGKRPPQLRSTK